MERTPSGRTIVTDQDLLLAQPAPGPADVSDVWDADDSEAALLVQQHLASYSARGSVRRHERILRTLINPPRGAGGAASDFQLDNAALESIFSAADAIFFQGRLTRRVQWEWSPGAVTVAGSGSGSGGSGSRIIGTTALREAGERGGYETLIVLSSPILTDTSYNRRLLISTFLHELIHAYLFIRCGFKARLCGGHTKGFQAIATTIDQWAGPGSLHLGDMEADLERFREEAPVCRHQGGSDLYEAQLAVRSGGLREWFGAHEHGADGRWTPSPSHVSSPMSTASTLVDKFGYGSYDGLDGGSRCVDVRGHTFLGTATQSYPLH